MLQPKVLAMTERKAATAEWAARPERSNTAIIRFMVWLSLNLGRPFGRLILRGIAAYFLAFAPAARRASQHYLARALGRPATLGDLYRHFFAFSTSLHDRIYLLNDRDDLFEVELIGDRQVIEAAAEGSGVIIVGAHMGSFEVLRAMARKHARFDLAVVMYQDNARKFNDVLAAINPNAAQNIIPLAQLDSMLQVKARLDQGTSIGMLGDRAPNDEGRVLRNFLGSPAPFPLGSFRLAALLKKPVFFMTGLYLGGNRYRIHCEALADFSAVDRAGRAAAIEQALDNYVDCLERHCRQSPYNWFNFFDFWAAAGPSSHPNKDTS